MKSFNYLWRKIKKTTFSMKNRFTNRLINGVACILLLCFGGGACNKSKTYAELVKDERKAIKKYIANNGIEVLNTFPADSVFGPNQYYLDEKGLYIHIEDFGERRLVREGEDVLIWFTKYGPLPDEDQNSTNMSDVKPDEFTYQGNYTAARYAWTRPLKYVGNGGKVKIIAPHTTGNTNDQTNVEAFAYDLEYVLTGFNE